MKCIGIVRSILFSKTFRRKEKRWRKRELNFTGKAAISKEKVNYERKN